MRKTKLFLTCALVALIGGVGISAHQFAAVAEETQDAPNKAQVGDKSYATFEEALENWTDGTTLRLLSDVELEGGISLVGKATRTLDLNGHVVAPKEGLRGTGSVLSLSAGTLTITDRTEAQGSLRGYENAVTSNGGVISVTEGATLNLEGGVICEGQTQFYGGGIYAENSTLNLSGGRVYGNSAQYSGGGVAVWDGVLNLSGTVISSNTSQSRGGGVMIYGGTQKAQATLSGGSVSYNEAYTSGGGVYVGDNGVLTLSGTTVDHNYAKTSGGGVMIYGETEKAEATFSGGSISENTTDENGGGVVIWKNASLTISESAQINKNHAAIGGGGIYMSGQTDELLGVLTMNGGTITENVAETGSGGGLKISAGEFIMNNGTVSSNQAVASDGGGISLELTAKASFGGSSVVYDNTKGDEENEVADNIWFNNVKEGESGSIKFLQNLTSDAKFGFNRTDGIICKSGDYQCDATVLKTVVFADDKDFYPELNASNDLIFRSDALRSISLEGSYKKDYAEGEDFDATGMVVRVIYKDGRTEELAADEYEIEGGKGLTSDSDVIVRYRNVTTRVSINVAGGAGAAASEGGSGGNLFGFIAVVTLSALFVIALIVVGIVTRGFKGKKKKAE